MKPTILTLLVSCGVLHVALGQLGEFDAFNWTAPTRLYAADGALAGPEILGQWLVGPTIHELTALGMPQSHDHGLVHYGGLDVPNVPCGQTAMVQLAAWDGTVWGENYGAVPPDQIGRTDIVPVLLTCLTQPLYYPEFTQPAIVPIPEPPVWAFALLAGSGWLVLRLRQCKAHHRWRKHAR